jgi:hypothetical protein
MRLFVKLLANFSGLANEDPWANHVRAIVNTRVSSRFDLISLFLVGEIPTRCQHAILYLLFVLSSSLHNLYCVCPFAHSI